MTRPHNLNGIDNRPPECHFIRNSLKASPAAQDGERKTSNGKNNDKSRVLASLGMTNKDAAE
jgi:hypothetical protein